MRQLLLNGVIYDVWSPSKQVEDLHPLVLEHIEHIFRAPCFYFTAKGNVTSGQGTGSNPDGYIIAFHDAPQWHIVIMDLSEHVDYFQIAAQFIRFRNAIENLKIRQAIIDELYIQIKEEETLEARFRDAVRNAKGQDIDIHRFIFELFREEPITTVIIQEYTDRLSEDLTAFGSARIEFVEFQTFIRRGIGEKSHAHLLSRYSHIASPV